MNYIDTHAHITGEEFANDIENIIERAKTEGVIKIMIPDVGIEGRTELRTICSQHSDYLLPMIGIHPTTINDQQGDWRTEVDAVEQILNSEHERFYAIGEIGLDNHWSREYTNEQQSAFVAQCELALQHNLPINVHTRDAGDEMCDILESFKGRGLRGVMHAFCGTEEEFRRVDKCGDFLFSIGGVVTYKKSQVARVVPSIPLEKLLLETDAPWLTPTPHRGTRNEPAHLKHICAKIAELHGVAPEVVASATTQNAIRIFDI